jgi:hypothetical protein
MNLNLLKPKENLTLPAELIAYLENSKITDIYISKNGLSSFLNEEHKNDEIIEFYSEGFILEIEKSERYHIALGFDKDYYLYISKKNNNISFKKKFISVKTIDSTYLSFFLKEKITSIDVVYHQNKLAGIKFSFLNDREMCFLVCDFYLQNDKGRSYYVKDFGHLITNKNLISKIQFGL